MATVVLLVPFVFGRRSSSLWGAVICDSCAFICFWQPSADRKSALGNCPLGCGSKSPIVDCEVWRLRADVTRFTDGNAVCAAEKEEGRPGWPARRAEKVRFS